jgi:hypothetical protein
MATDGEKQMAIDTGSSQVVDPQTQLVTQHLVVQGAPTIIRNPAAAIQGSIRLPGLSTRVTPEGPVRVLGRLMHFYLVPPNQDGGDAFRGHLVLVWTASGHTYAYGFHELGQTFAVARALDLELVHHLVAVYPRSSPDG